MLRKNRVLVVTGDLRFSGVERHGLRREIKGVLGPLGFTVNPRSRSARAPGLLIKYLNRGLNVVSLDSVRTVDLAAMPGKGRSAPPGYMILAVNGRGLKHPLEIPGMRITSPEGLS